MTRTAWAIPAVLGLMATPAMADLMPSGLTPTYKSLNPMPGVGTVFAGHYNTAGTAFYGADTKIHAAESDYVTLTFAFHWPFYTTVTGIQFWSSLVYDNNEVAVVGTAPPVAGPFAGKVNNFPGPTTWAGWDFSSGTWTVGDVLGTGVPLVIGSPATGSVSVVGSGVYPFMQVVLHVKDDLRADSIADIIVGSAALAFRLPGSPTTWFTGGAVGSTTYGVDILPEPASVSLLGVGALAIGAGVWRRRRS